MAKIIELCRNISLKTREEKIAALPSLDEVADIIRRHTTAAIKCWRRQGFEIEEIKKPGFYAFFTEGMTANGKAADNSTIRGLFAVRSDYYVNWNYDPEDENSKPYIMEPCWIISTGKTIDAATLHCIVLYNKVFYFNPSETVHAPFSKTAIQTIVGDLRSTHTIGFGLRAREIVKHDWKEGTTIC